MKGITLSLTCLVAAVVTGCTVHQTEPPPLAGPSELALSVTMTASPDTLVSGGQQQASIGVQARDAGGGPKANQVFQLYTAVDGASVPFGTLSTDRVVTGVDGRATAIYTMPQFTQYDAGTPSRKVSVYAVSVGTDYAAANAHNVQLLVIPPAIPASVPGGPTAALTASTTSAKVGQLVTFDGSASIAGPGAAIVGYHWNFGDAQANDEHGVDASHAFTSPGTYTVIMGVQDDSGRIGTAFKTIVVAN